MFIRGNKTQRRTASGRPAFGVMPLRTRRQIAVTLSLSGRAAAGGDGREGARVHSAHSAYLGLSSVSSISSSNLHSHLPGRGSACCPARESGPITRRTPISRLMARPSTVVDGVTHGMTECQAREYHSLPATCPNLLPTCPPSFPRCFPNFIPTFVFRLPFHYVYL